jgi:formamidopyrimidine-DNA glycosylase
VYAAEALWATRLSPWARVGDIARSDLIMLVNYASRILNEHLNALSDDGFVNLVPFEVYGRNGHVCNRCGESIKATNTPPDNRPLYWCPKCQTRLDWRLLDDTPPGGAQPS